MIVAAVVVAESLFIAVRGTPFNRLCARMNQNSSDAAYIRKVTRHNVEPLSLADNNLMLNYNLSFLPNKIVNM